MRKRDYDGGVGGQLGVVSDDCVLEREKVDLSEKVMYVVVVVVVCRRSDFAVWLAIIRLTFSSFIF